MTAATGTVPGPKKSSPKPSLGRSLAGKYLDILFCGFAAWVAGDVFGWGSYWTSLGLFFWVAVTLWCRDRLKPTPGEYSLGIRYLTSSSSHVVAEIQVIHPKLRLNGFLLTAGVVELNLALLFFSGWTFLPKVVLGGMVWEGPLSITYWIGAGLAFFLSGSYLLSGSRHARWVPILVHGAVLGDLYLSAGNWRAMVNTALISPGVQFLKQVPFHGLEFFALWSLILTGIVVFSRKLLVN